MLSDGYRTKQPELGRPGVPILRVAEVLDGRIAPAFGDHVRNEFRSRFRTKTSLFGDVVVTTKGTVGRVARIGVDDPEFVYAPQLCFFRVTDDGINSRFLYYWFRSDDFRRQAAAVKAQTDMADYINLADIRAIRITLPTPSEQRAIAEVLGALDDKIESNRRIIAASQAIMAAEADLLEGARIPLGDLVYVSRETVSPSSMGDRPIDLFSIPAFDAGCRPERVDPGSIRSGKTRVDGEALLLSRLNPRFPRLWHAVPESGVVALCSTEFMVLRPRRGRTLADIWLACAQPEFQEEMVQRATGTSGSHQRVRPSDVLAIELADPIAAGDDARQEAAELLELVESARRQSSRLSALRDALLPELLSGRLRVRDAERVT